MVAQADVNERVNGHGSNRGLFHFVTEFISDVINLGELQIQLFIADGSEGLGRVVAPLVVLITGTFILLGCLPLAMATSVVAVAELGGFSYLAAAVLALGIWLILGGVIGLVGIVWMRSRWRIFERSFTELRANAQWIRAVLKQMAGSKRPLTPNERFL